VKDCSPTTDPALHSTSLPRALAGVATLLAAAALLALPGRPALAAPVVSVSPQSGSPGTEITVRGTGFPAAVIQIHWGTQDGPHLATTAGPEFAVSATVPDAPTNSHQIFAVIRTGNSVTTSSAPFQVTAGEVVTTTSTTVAEPVTTTEAPAGRGPASSAANARPASGVGGGAEDMADTVGGTSGGQPAAGTGGAAGTASTATSTTASVATTVPGAPGAPVDAAAGGPPPSSGAPMPGDTAAPASGQRAATDAALGQRPATQSSGVVSNPALLVVGLGMVFLGGAFLAIRNRHRPGA
jgi:hypothetical protein